MEGFRCLIQLLIHALETEAQNLPELLGNLNHSTIRTGQHSVTLKTVRSRGVKSQLSRTSDKMQLSERLQLSLPLGALSAHG